MPFKPHIPIVNRSVDQAQGLKFHWSVPNNQTATYDPIQGLTIPHLATTANIMTPAGIAMKADGNLLGAVAAAPPSLQNLLPCSLMVVFWQGKAVPVDGAFYLGVSYQSTFTDPYAQCVLQRVDPGFQLKYNDGGTFGAQASSSITLGLNRLHVLIATMSANAGGEQRMYLNGQSIMSTTGSMSAINAGTGAVVGIGQLTSDQASVHTGAFILDARIYNRVLSQSEARNYSATWDAIYIPVQAHRRRRFSLPSTAAAVIGNQYYYRQVGGM